MTDPSHSELQSTIEAQGVLNKQFARLIVEQVTGVMAGNLNAVLVLIEKQGSDRQSETDRLAALIGGLSADLGKLGAGQAQLAAQISDVSERVDELDTRHGHQWDEINERMKASEADRASLHERVERLTRDLADLRALIGN